MAQKSRWQKLEAAGHIMPVVRREQEFVLSQPPPHPRILCLGSSATYSGWILSSVLNYPNQDNL